MSLRLRLTLIAVVLVGAGLVAAGIATHAFLENFLVDRVDGDLQAAQVPALHALADGDHDGPGGPAGIAGNLPPGSYAALLSPTGTVLKSASLTESSSAPPNSVRAAPYGTHSVGGYRVLRVRLAGAGAGSSLVIAAPLADVRSTLNRLAMLELLVGLVVLAAVAVLASVLVRLGLRPLRDIEETAAGIAAGDLDRRIEGVDPGTEVGRLADALNAMLGRIEDAFREREASERRLRRFVADASHELRTPLTSVRGYAELFRRGAADNPEDLEMAMRRIEEEAERMGVLVDDLLLLARLDQGRPLEQEPVDVAALARDLAHDARLLYPEWPLSVEVDEPAVVVGDELRLRQALANLVGNARSHCPPGTPISLTVRRDVGEVELSVTDAGPGIPDEHVGRVFERFYRADPSRARASGGNGLGLSIVASISEAHGGSASVESGAGRGSTFRIRLPAATGAPVTAPSSSP